MMATTINKRCSYIHLVCVACITILLFACSENESILDKNSAYVTFRVETPYYKVPTYAMNAIAENTITTIDVLAFRVDDTDGKEYFAYRSEATSISDKGNLDEKEFTVQLKKDDYFYRFVVLANVKAELDSFSLSTTGVKDPVLARLVSENSAQWNATSSSNFTPIPMWGETPGTMQITAQTTSITGISLLRSLAAIDVQVAPATQTKFTLAEVYLYNRKTRGRVTPINAYYNKAEKKVSDPSLPLDSDPANPLTIQEGLAYTTTDPTKMINQIYTYEAVGVESGADLKATCVVVGGRYNGQPDITYYRIDLKKMNGTTFEKYMSVLRNHRYIVNITAVSDKGYGTPDEAFYQKKGSMSVDIQEWNMGDMAEVVVDGNYSLTVGQGLFEVVSENAYYGYLSIQTDHPAGWSVSASDAWINIAQIRTGSIDFTLAQLPVGVNTRAGEIVVKAGNTTKTIAVKQTRP